MRPVAAVTPDASAAAPALGALRSLETELRRVVDDKSALVDVALCALLSGGHVLLEDVPGVGKTTFIKALARLLGTDFARIQFTSDLMPSDIVGVEVYDPGTQAFVFHRGPIFTRVLLADELNRASPRTQSALLEAMGEGHVTVDRKTYELPKPFVVFASQNPMDSVGTYELPESQLDRFAAKVKIGYPSEKREAEIFQAATLDPLAGLPQGIVRNEDLQALMAAVDKIHISERVATYAKRVVDRSRASEKLRVGVSTRGGVIWLRMARALALRAGRDYVLPDDLQALGPACLGHRVVTQSGASGEAVVKDLLAGVPVD